MFLRYLLTAFATFIFAACATSRGFNRGELRNQMAGETPVITDDAIKKTLTLKPQLPKPFKIGVYFQEPSAPNRYTNPNWHWNAEDKDRILSLANDMKKSREISDVFVISHGVTESSDLKSIRLAAAQHGADAVLVVSGVDDIDRYTNNWGWTYIGLVTALFVPATEVDGLFMARATMWDVRNEFLYMTAEAESLKNQTRPAAYTNEKLVINEAKTDAVTQLRGEISKMVAGLIQKKADKEVAKVSKE